jgi:hypothetical protein
MSPHTHVELFPAYTIPQAHQVISSIVNPEQVDAVILHLITNDVAREIAAVTASKMATLATDCCGIFPHARVLISLGISRSDNDVLNNRVWEVNGTLWDIFQNHPQVGLIDNMSLSHNGLPNLALLESDGYHLNKKGTSILAAHMRAALKARNEP